MTRVPVGPLMVPWAGGAYFRLIPYQVFRRGVAKQLRTTSWFTFYLHPWELDPGQPRMKNLSLSQRIRHYSNLDQTEKRLEKLLNDFEFTTMREVLGL